MSYAKDPAHFVEFMHLRRPTSVGVGTRNQSVRIDIGKYNWLLVCVSAAVIGQIDLTPLMYDAPSGGTGIRLDGTGGRPDYSIHYSTTDDNLGSATQIRCAGLPGRYLGFEEVLAATSVYSIVVLGFTALSSRKSDFHTPLALTDVKSAHSGFA